MDFVIDHPVMTLILVVSNLIIAGGSIVMGLAVLPRLRRTWNLTLVAGAAFFMLNGAQHLDITVGILFSGDLAGVPTSWHLIALRVAIALSLVAFIGGIYQDVREWNTMQDRSK